MEEGTPAERTLREGSLTLTTMEEENRTGRTTAEEIITLATTEGENLTVATSTMLTIKATAEQLLLRTQTIAYLITIQMTGRRLELLPLLFRARIVRFFQLLLRLRTKCETTSKTATVVSGEVLHLHRQRTRSLLTLTFTDRLDRLLTTSCSTISHRDHRRQAETGQLLLRMACLHLVHPEDRRHSMERHL